MLVLTRCKDETIRIGHDIEIRVIRLSRGCVKIGITAPQHVNVVRGELLDRDISGKGNCHGSDN